MERHFLIGTDPEIFLADKDGKIFSAHEAIPGTKDQPFAVPGGAIQVDGMALEFNINPAKTVDEFTSGIEQVMAELQRRVTAKYPDSKFAVVPVAHFDADYLATLPRDVIRLGCTPDYNVYLGGEPNPPPDGNRPMRTASGHIHVGIPFDSLVERGVIPPLSCKEDKDLIIHTLVRQLDFALYIPSLLWDKDTLRREMYGQPGTFRYKPYGLEYRVLSNAWLADKRLQRYVFQMTQWACEMFFEQDYFLPEDSSITPDKPSLAVSYMEGELNAPEYPYWDKVKEENNAQAV